MARIRWTLVDSIPRLFNKQTVGMAEFKEQLGGRLNLPANRAKDVATELQEKGLAVYQRNKGRILFRLRPPPL